MDPVFGFFEMLSCRFDSLRQALHMQWDKRVRLDVPIP
jgi:hypothetical protein